MLPHFGPPGDVWARLARVAPRAEGPREALPAGLPIIAVGGQVPWQAAMEPRLRGLLGHSALADSAIRYLSRGAPSTVDSYGSHWGQFQAFCDREGRVSLPASESTILLYVASLGERGTVKASSLQPYLSAINRIHRDVTGVEVGPAGGSLLTKLRQGIAWEQSQAPSIPSNTRVALPAEIPLLAVVVGRAMRNPQIRNEAAELREITAVALGFLCMGRADTMVHIGERDITWSASHLYIVLEHEKGRSRREDPRARTLVFPVQPSLQPLIDVLEKWRVCRMTWGHSTLFFALKGETLHKSPHVPMTAWLLNVCARLNEQPPPGYAWSSHSLRKGGASAASAIGVPLSTIRHIGGWAVSSSVVNQYIDPAVLASVGAWFFFGAFAPTSPPPGFKFLF